MNRLPAHISTVIGLEIHVQLQTRTKLFCGCSTEFGQSPNSQTCPVCIGMPGAIPVLNRDAILLAIRAGLGLGCQIARRTEWDRKNYFYPDLPKGYQISQLEHPVCGPGHLDFPGPDDPSTHHSVRITRAHLEEDAGKSLHDESMRGGNTRIDLNRAGTPLLEIVTEPDLRSPAQARAFLNELKLLLTYLEVSDCNMQQGNLRVDANINLHIQDGQSHIPTPIVEVKNMNSFRAVERALEFEAQRQWEAWQADGRVMGEVPKATRGWDDNTQSTVPQREKEESADYRYFPEPDLSVVEISDELIDDLRDQLPELPTSLRRRLQSEYGLTHYDADVMTSQGRELVTFFESLAGLTGNNKVSANWVTQDVLRVLNEKQWMLADFPVPLKQLSALINKQLNRELDQSRAKTVFDLMVSENLRVVDAMDRLGIRSVDDTELQEICDRVIQENESICQQIKEGNTKAVGALIGAAKKVNPNVDAGKIRLTLMQRLGE